jgi:hypothetical protein
LWADVVSTVGHVEYTEHIETRENTANDWQALSSVLRKKYVAKAVKL